jgi:small subunit ribosomal protein S11
MAEESDNIPAEKEVPAAEATPTPAPAPVAEVAPKPAPAVEEPVREKTAADVFLELDGGEEKVKILKAKGSKNVHVGIVHVQATFNNTIVSVTDMNGNIVGWSSAGKLGFRGSRKSTAYAAQLVSQDACRQAMSHGLREVEVRVKGPGSGRESAVRAVQGLGIEVTCIKDVTPVPHNGCRPPKARRV